MGKNEETKEYESAGCTNVGSWIVSYDRKGYPFWTNDVTGETTYRLFVERNAFAPRLVRQRAQEPLARQPWSRRTRAGSEEELEEKPKGREKKITAGGTWKEVWKADGSRKWIHTGTKRETHVDPYS